MKTKGPLPPADCPSCFYVMDSATCVSKGQRDAIPSVGDMTVCMRCGQILTYTETLGLRKLTDDERKELESDPETKSLTEEAVRAVNSIRHLMDEKHGPIPHAE
jgi:hypothetical protein